MGDVRRKYKPFVETLPFGNEAQERVANLLRSKGGFANKVDDRARYDFELHFNNHVFRVEVKNEDNYATTGNICLETRQGWPLRPSGVAFSEATICVHTLQENAALFRRREMHQWLRDVFRTGKRQEDRFGDNNNRGYVVPLREFFGVRWFDYCPITCLPDSELWTF